jgi:hypothetical protein
MIGLKYAEHLLSGVQILLEWTLKQNERLRQSLLNADEHYRRKQFEMRNARDF